MFSLSEVLILSLVALFFYGASGHGQCQHTDGHGPGRDTRATEGRVAAVNMLFIQTSNEGGDFRGGALAGLLGPVYTVLVGGVLGLGFLVWSRKKFPELYTLDKISDLSPQEETLGT